MISTYSSVKKKRRKRTKLLMQMFFLVVIHFLIGGCAAVGPDYSPPTLSMPETWHSEKAAGIAAGESNFSDLAHWWQRLQDPQLSSLIQKAVVKNLDMKKARAKIQEARARRDMAAAGLSPSVTMNASAAWSRSGYLSDKSSATNLYASSLDASWELDIFGGVRRSVEAYTGDLQASEEDLRDTLVTLLSEVAFNYIDVRIYQARIAEAEQTIKSQEETYQLIVWKNQAGLSDDLEVRQARYSLENSRSKLPALRAGLQSSLNNIAVLLGEHPGSVHEYLQNPQSIPTAPIDIAVGVPADILRQRPDVRRAERQLAAQTARIGVATADLYPKFTLSGSIGLETTSLSSIGTSGLWTLLGKPNFSWNIFKAGAIRQNIKAQTALQEQYVAAYEAAVLTALKEVENALIAYAEEIKHRQTLIAAVEAAEEAAKMSQINFESGLTHFINVLDAQRSLLTYRDELAQSEGAVAADIVRLYKALGGGWTTFSETEEKSSKVMGQEDGRE
jgi:NodT family efflux transporter outer membrane factor (OMF) lipoprotein